MRQKKVTFKNDDGVTLHALLDLPADGRPTGYALFAHCFTCSKNLRAVSRINQSLTAEGLAVLRFDFTGLGESEGAFADTNFSSNVADLLAAARFMGEAYAAPQLLIGHSLGGAAVLQAAAALPEVLAVAVIGAPADPSHVRALLTASEAEIEAEGAAEVTLGGRPFMIKKQFLDDLEEQQMSETIGGLKRPLLILHAPLDNTVGIDNASRIFQIARHPKSFVSLDQADHLLSDEADARYVGHLISAWSERYLQSTHAEAADEAVDDRVIVRTEAGYRTEIRASGHALVADEPLSLGGSDEGANPYEYLLAGLGACSSITVRMYADRKGWPLESVTVKLRHSKINVDSCDECETPTGKVDLIEREIAFVGDLDEEQVARLLQIADKCPVHKTLRTETVIRTTLGVDDG